jgi:hypothetical protein
MFDRRLGHSGWVVTSAVAITFGVAGCSSAPSPRPTSVPTPTAAGLVIGGLEPCSGIVFASPQPFAAGTIVVLRGVESASGSLPTTIVATQVVGSGAEFRFTLPAGQYVLVGHYTEPGSIAPWVPVTVTAAATTSENIPNRCA